MATFINSDNRLNTPTLTAFSDVLVANTGAVTVVYTCPTGKISLVQLYRWRMPVGNKTCNFLSRSSPQVFTGAQVTVKTVTALLNSTNANYDPRLVGTPQREDFFLRVKTIEELVFHYENQAQSFLLTQGMQIAVQITGFGGVDSLNASYRVYEFNSF
jgi:hypothetical protein